MSNNVRGAYASPLCVKCGANARFGCGVCLDAVWCARKSCTNALPCAMGACSLLARSTESHKPLATQTKRHGSPGVVDDPHPKRHTSATHEHGSGEAGVQPVYDGLSIIGAGASGVIYVLPNGHVMKAMSPTTAMPAVCALAEKEYHMQLRVFAMFQSLHDWSHDVLPEVVDNDYTAYIAMLVATNVVVPKPIRFSSTPVQINGRTYECALEMERLHGIPLSRFNAADPTTYARFDPTYLAKRGFEMEVMGQLAFGSGEYEGIHGQRSLYGLIGDTNPTAGYFMEKSSIMLDHFRTRYGEEKNLTLSNAELSEVIGFIYGWFVCHGHLMPTDIEIALGVYGNMTRVNVLDFGFVSDVDTIADSALYSGTFRAFATQNPRLHDMALYREFAKIAISGDLYGNPVDDPDVRRGYEAACEFSKTMMM